MNEDDYAFLNFCEQTFHLTGRLPNEYQSIAVGHSKRTYQRCVKLPVFNKALDARGIREGYASLDGDGNIDPQLTPEMLNAANVLLDLRDNRSAIKKLKELAIPTQKYETWLRDESFQRYLMIRSQKLLEINGHEAHLALIQRVRAGELGAIKYFNEITGYYVPERTKGVDVQSVILRVIEIIQIHVSDPAIQSAIADGLLEIVRENAPQLNHEPVIRPQIKQSLKPLPSIPTRPLLGIEEEPEPVKPQPIIPTEILR